MLTVRGQPASGDDAVQVGMVVKRLPPGVEDGGGADGGTEVLGIGGDGQQRLGAQRHLCRRRPGGRTQ